MAEYFPLLDRAVSGLTEPTAEARRSIYERARTALIGQLRRMDPPVPEDDIARESAALDEAIARVEAMFPEHGGGRAPDAPPAAPDAPVPAAAPALPPASASPPVARVPPPPLPLGTPPVVPPPSRERPVLGPRPAPAAAPSTATPATAPAVAPARPALGPATRPPLPARGTRPVMALRPVVPVPARDPVRDPVRDGPAVGPAEPAADAGPPAEAVPVEAVPVEAVRVEAASSETRPAEPRAPAAAGFAAVLDEAARENGEAAPSSAEVPAPPRPRETGTRPPAPRPREAFGWSRRTVAAGLAAVVLAMAGMGIAAYGLRDRPEQVVATRSPATDASDPATTAGKVAERAPSGDAEAVPTSGASVPAPVPQGLEATAAAPSIAAPSIAVAQRAALLVDAPDEPQRVHTYVGTVVWHLDSVSPGGGQPLASAVKADVDIPDAGLKVTMLMQKNPEPQLPASHTIEFHFLPQAGNSLGPVKQINVPEMRRDDDAPTGDPLAGVPVAITENYFLVGLTRGAAENQNVRLITERNWFDMSVLFSSGKLGKLTFEKGAGGQRVIEDALKAWK